MPKRFVFLSVLLLVLSTAAFAENPKWGVGGK